MRYVCVCMYMFTAETAETAETDYHYHLLSIRRLAVDSPQVVQTKATNM